MGWWPCSGCGENDCTCAMSIDVTVSGVVDQACTNTLNLTKTGLALGEQAGTTPSGIDTTCQTLGSINAAWSTSPNVNGGFCATSATTNYLAVFIDTAGLIVGQIVASHTDSGTTWLYHWLFKSALAYDQYITGSPITLVYHSLVKTSSGGGPDPGLAAMPHDGGSASFSVTINSCCNFCKDGDVGQMSVAIAGITDGAGCSDCSEINGTYLCDPQTRPSSGTFANRCIWQVAHNFNPDPDCSGAVYQSALVTVSIYGTSTTRAVDVHVQLYGGANATGSLLGTIIWQQFDSTGTKYDCLGFSSLAASRLSNSSACDYSASTCLVTAS